MKENEAVEACKNAAAALEKLSMVMQDAFKVKTGVEPNEPELPKRWEDLGKFKGAYIDSDCGIHHMESAEFVAHRNTRNTFATLEQAEAAIALAQLSQLREVYRQGWKPDWNDEGQEKYAIYFMSGEIEKYKVYSLVYFLTFQSAQIRDQFLENFRDLIEQAKPLMS